MHEQVLSLDEEALLLELKALNKQHLKLLRKRDHTMHAIEGKYVIDTVLVKEKTRDFDSAKRAPIAPKASSPNLGLTGVSVGSTRKFVSPARARDSGVLSIDSASPGSAKPALTGLPLLKLGEVSAVAMTISDEGYLRRKRITGKRHKQKKPIDDDGKSVASNTSVHSILPSLSAAGGGAVLYTRATPQSAPNNKSHEYARECVEVTLTPNRPKLPRERKSLRESQRTVPQSLPVLVKKV